MAASEPVRVITGPTAAGKSAVAMAFAARFPVTIVSADSRQIYRGFDIGTAKPTPAERAAVPHLGIDIAGPTERYSAGRWGEAAEGWVNETRRADRIPLVVGGTGFYLRALFAPFFDEPPLDPVRRAALRRWLDAVPTETLRQWCETLDPDRAHLGRAQLLRAIEIALLTGRRLTVLHRERRRPARLDARYLVVEPGASLGSRIARRVAEMFHAGWVEEVAALVRTVPPDAPAWNATGYSTVRRVIGGELSEEDAIRTVTIETRQYAKRQRTWLRHQLAGARVTRVDPYAADFSERVERWWTAS